MLTARAWDSSATAAASAPAFAPRARRPVLFICYHFPPDASVGSIRPAKFVKYLTRLGWNPSVVTVRERYLRCRDDTRLADVADLPVIRTRVWPTVLELALVVKRFFARVASSGHPPACRSAPAAPDRRQGRFSSSIKRYLNSLFELPDKQIGWLVPAAWHACRLVRSEHVRVVVTSSPPWTSALVGLFLSYVAPIKLVTDLRDPWVTPYRRDSWFLGLRDVAESRSAVGEMVLRWLEKKLIERSARIITTTERHALAIRQAYPGIADGRVSVIPNGFDAEDFAALPAVPVKRRFTLAYIGTFYLDRSPKHVFTALSELVREGRLSASKLEVNLVGSVEETGDGSLHELIVSSGLAHCVHVEGLVSHHQSLLRMMQADVLLLYQPQPYCSIPGKAFEYLAAGKRILCLARDGATADLIHQTRGGVVVAPDDVAGIKAALRQFIDEFEAGEPAPRRSEVAVFERAGLARQLSGLLAELL